MNKYVCFLVLISVVNIHTAEDVREKYSWQDYNKGVVPANALAAGRGKDGKLVFIGQVSYEGKEIPGTIYENDENIYFEFEQQPLVANENVKILCTDHPENFEWISGQIYTIHDLLQHTTLIEGGYQKDHFLTFIGRVYIDGKIEIGKIICRRADCLPLYINADGKVIKSATFGVLAYNSNI